MVHSKFIFQRDVYASSTRQSRFERLVRFGSALCVSLAALLATPQATVFAQTVAEGKKCLYVSSYHRGYPWSDGVERGLRSVLEGQCEIKQFDMDTKRNKSKEFKVAKALEVKAIIESWKPDVVITSDDNAAKFLIQPHYKDAAVPFVFCGVNWTAKDYGFPYSNVTGMVEVGPIQPMLRSAMSIAGKAKRVLYIGADTLSEKKNLARFAAAAEEFDLELDNALVGSTEAWLNAYRTAQDYDFIIVGSNSGIDDWDEARIGKEVSAASTKLSVTAHDWMMPFTMLGFAKVAEEQGEWSANSALAILSGTSPSKIPVIANRKWNLWLNEGLVNETDLTIPLALSRRAKRVSG